MSTARAYRERLQAIRWQYIEIAGECMLEHKTDIAALVVDQQYDKGIDGANKPLTPYTKAYDKLKTKAGSNRGFADFHMTGKMQAEMDLQLVGNEQYEIFSNREVPSYRLSDLLKKRDPLSFSLTEENRKVVWRIIEPSFVDKVKERI